MTKDQIYVLKDIGDLFEVFGYGPVSPYVELESFADAIGTTAYRMPNRLATAEDYSKVVIMRLICSKEYSTHLHPLGRNESTWLASHTLT